MPWSNNQFTGTLVIPTGATTGARIEIDGTTGRIEVYDAADVLVYVIDGSIPGATAGPAGSPQAIMGATASLGYVQFPTNRAIEDFASVLLAAVGDAGLATEYATLQLQGPAVTGANDRLVLAIHSQKNDGSTTPSVALNNTSVDFLVFRETHLKMDPVSSAFPCIWINAAAAHTGNLLRTQVNSSDRLTNFVDGRLRLDVGASANSAFLVEVANGHTGNLVRVRHNSTDRFTVDPSGNANASRSLTAGNMDWGTAQTAAPGAGGGTTTVSVNFSKTFPNTPRVVAQCRTTTDPGTVTIDWRTDNISTTGFDLRAYRSTNAATNFDWYAVSD